MKIILFITLILISFLTRAHSGGTITSGPNKGCHTNHSTNDFHCHNKASKETKYTRAFFGGWSDVNHDCRDTRAEVLIKESKTAVVMKKNGCRVLSGSWDDFYYNESLSLASEIDVDHVVPLKHAYEIGAKNWDIKKRIAFANDPENLVITNLKYNRQKGAKTPDQWLPVQREYACKYLERFIRVKEKYELKIETSEIVQRDNICKM